MLSSDVIQLRRLATGLDLVNPATNEAQRADAAPRATGGDGFINSADVVQGRRYATGLDPITNAGGPTAPSLVPDILSSILEEIKEYFFGREIRVGSQEAVAGNEVSVPVEITPHGDETAMSFTIEYDPKVLSNPRVMLGEFAPVGSTLTINVNENGRIGILIDSTEPMTASAMPKQLLTVTFDAIGNEMDKTTVRITDSLAIRGISDGSANLLSARYVDGDVILIHK